MVEIFNFYYFMYIIAAFALFFALYFILRKKSPSVIKKVLFALLLGNFALHFIKLAFPPCAGNMPRMLRKITPENICAVAVLAFPWIFLSKNKTLKDYMFYFGILGALAGLLYPTEAIDSKAVFSFDVIRFYICHSLLGIVSALMVVLKQHKLDYKRVFRMPAVFIGVLSVVFLNEIFLALTGWAQVDFSRLTDPSYRNYAFVFGPLPSFEKIAEILILPLVPKIFLGDYLGAAMYWPVVWLVVPAFVYLPVISFLMCLPIEYKRIKRDVKRLVQKKRRGSEKGSIV